MFNKENDKPHTAVLEARDVDNERVFTAVPTD